MKSDNLLKLTKQKRVTTAFLLPVISLIFANNVLWCQNPGEKIIAEMRKVRELNVFPPEIVSIAASYVTYNPLATESMIKAIMSGDVEELRSALENAADPNASLWNGTNPLTLLLGKIYGPNLTLSDKYRLIQVLLEYGADPLTPDGNRVLPIRLIFSQGDEAVGILIFLLKKNKEEQLKAWDIEGKPNFFSALQSLYVLHYLLEKGVDFSMKDNRGRDILAFAKERQAEIQHQLKEVQMITNEVAREAAKNSSCKSYQ